MATIKVLITGDIATSQAAYGAEYASYHTGFASWLGDAPANGGPDDLTVSQNSVIVELTDEFLGEANALIENDGLVLDDALFNSSDAYYVTIRPRQDIPSHGHVLANAVCVKRTTRFTCIDLKGYHRVEGLAVIGENNASNSDGMRMSDLAVIDNGIVIAKGYGHALRSQTKNATVKNCTLVQSGATRSTRALYTSSGGNVLNCTLIGIGTSSALQVDTRDDLKIYNNYAAHPLVGFAKNSGAFPRSDKFDFIASTDASATTANGGTGTVFDNLSITDAFETSPASIAALISGGDFRLKSTSDLYGNGDTINGPDIGPSSAFVVAGGYTADLSATTFNISAPDVTLTAEVGTTFDTGTSTVSVSANDVYFSESTLATSAVFNVSGHGVIMLARSDYEAQQAVFNASALSAFWRGDFTPGLLNSQVSITARDIHTNAAYLAQISGASVNLSAEGVTYGSDTTINLTQVNVSAHNLILDTNTEQALVSALMTISANDIVTNARAQFSTSPAAVLFSAQGITYTADFAVRIMRTRFRIKATGNKKCAGPGLSLELNLRI